MKIKFKFLVAVPFLTTTPKSEELQISITGEETENGLVIRVDERERLTIVCQVSGPYSDLKTIIYKDQVILASNSCLKIYLT